LERSLEGRAGNDVLNSGDGVDTYVFSSALGGNNIDTILNFITGTFRLDHTILTGQTPGLVPVVSNHPAVTTGPQIVYKPLEGGRLFYDVNSAAADDEPAAPAGGTEPVV